MPVDLLAITSCYQVLSSKVPDSHLFGLPIVYIFPLLSVFTRVYPNNKRVYTNIHDYKIENQSGLSVSTIIKLKKI
jgi:hypothetical protein